MRNLVVVKYLNGYMLRGRTFDIGNRNIFPLVTTDNKKMEIRIADLKAVFFLRGEKEKSYVKPKGDQPGIRLVVQFVDGEELIGTSFDYSLKKTHFYLFPSDPEDSNERVLVNRKAARFISRLSDGKEPHSGKDDEVFRKGFERTFYRFLYTLAQQFNNPLIQIDKTTIINHHISFKKEFGQQVREYVMRFGDEAWCEFFERKMGEIELDMGDRSLKPILKICGNPRKSA